MHKPSLSRRQLVALVATAQALSQTPRTSARQASTDALANGWDDLIAPFLASDFWNERDMYDAAHILMVPLHVATDPSAPDHWIKQFDDAVARFLNSHTGA